MRQAAPDPVNRLPGPLRAGDLVMCDFDGTVSLEDTGLLVFNALELDEAWEIEHRWRRGEIGSMECMDRQWGLVRLPEAQLLGLFDSFELDPAFGELVNLCSAVRAGLVVVSDGLDLYLDRMLRRAGFEACDGDRVLEVVQARREPGCVPRFVNHASLTDGRITIQYPLRADECSACGNCKTAHLFRLRPYFGRVLFIGDGYSDMCVARYADLVFARDHLLAYCQREGIPHMPFERLGEVVVALRSPTSIQENADAFPPPIGP